MAEHFPARIFEHNNWANLKIIEVCSALSDEQLDAEPQTVVKGSIRETLTHLVSSQHNYLSTLTLPVEERKRITPAASEWSEAAKRSGEGLIAFAKDPSVLKDRLQTTDGYFVEPWVVMVQIINHAHEHREQICSMLNALGITPPDMDGWAYGEAAGGLVPMSK